MKSPRLTSRLVTFFLALAAAAASSGCASMGGIYGGGPSARPLPPPCVETFRGEWILEGAGGEAGTAPLAPPPVGASRISITRTNILQKDPPVDFGAYRILGVAGAAVDLGVQGPTPVHIVCNHPDKIAINEDRQPGSRQWFYRRDSR